MSKFDDAYIKKFQPKKNGDIIKTFDKYCKDLKGEEYDACVYRVAYHEIRTLAYNHEKQAHVRIAEIQNTMDDIDSELGIYDYATASSEEIGRKERAFGA